MAVIYNAYIRTLKVRLVCLFNLGTKPLSYSTKESRRYIQ